MKSLVQSFVITSVEVNQLTITIINIAVTHYDVFQVVHDHHHQDCWIVKCFFRFICSWAFVVSFWDARAAGALYVISVAFPVSMASPCANLNK